VSEHDGTRNTDDAALHGEVAVADSRSGDRDLDLAGLGLFQFEVEHL